jgi:hypothetical protein
MSKTYLKSDHLNGGGSLRLAIGICEPMPAKPKWTRRRTYQRIRNEIQALEARVGLRSLSAHSSLPITSAGSDIVSCSHAREGGNRTGHNRVDSRLHDGRPFGCTRVLNIIAVAD